MSLNTPRRPTKPWTWTLIGLLQLGNAVAFAAVAATVDFSTNADSEQIVVTAVDENSASPADAPDANAGGNDDVTMPTLAVDPTLPIVEPTPPVEVPDVDVLPVAPSDQAEPVPQIITPAIEAPTIVNAASNALAVRFIVNGELIELQPGERRELSGGDAWVVRFHRGGEFGAALEPIYDGAHQFVITPQGWRLERTADAP